LLAQGHALTIDIDPREPCVRLVARQPGLGDQKVGQRVVFRQWLGPGGDDPVTAEELDQVFASVHRWLDSPEAAAHLVEVSRGYRVSRMWSGDQLADWSPASWAAAGEVISGILAAMEDGSGA
jgi:hypothetical protein